MREGYNTKLKLRIDWADIDLFGHVNNVAFFRYIQAARVNYCELVGLTSISDKTRLSFMVASSQCQFRSPLHYPGDITVFTRVDWIKNTSFQLVYQILDHSGRPVAEAADVLVVFDHHKKIKALIQPELKKEIEKREGRSV